MMKIYRSHCPEPTDDGPGPKSPAGVATRGRRAEGDITATARCPRCRFEIVVRMGRTRPVLWCRCPARATLKRAA